jgi:MFS family permease
MVAWGIVMTLMSLVKSFEGLVVRPLYPHGLFPPNLLHLTHIHHPQRRIFLGLTEAGLFPGVTYYISLWYKRDEQSKRVAIFFSAATVAGAFGGLLAFGIEKMEGIAGLDGWAWIVCSPPSCLVSMRD